MVIFWAVRGGWVVFVGRIRRHGVLSRVLGWLHFGVSLVSL